MFTRLSSSNASFTFQFHFYIYVFFPVFTVTMADSLIELDSLEVVIVLDNEVDPQSPYPNPQFSSVSNRFIHIALNSPHIPQNRGKGTKELKMSQFCCGAQGLSLMIVRSYAFNFYPVVDLFG